MNYYQRRFQRKAHKDHMLDRCVIQKPKPLQDGSGQLMPYWDDGPEMPCGFDFRLAREDFGEFGEISKSFGFLRLPLGTDVDMGDRVKLIKRNGDLLDPPWIFEINGEPRIGPTAILIGLRETDQ